MTLPQIVAAREAATLAPYATHSAASAGRDRPEPPHPYRGPFERDRDRIVHCAAFRRLSQKTQVFTGDLGDYHRTRLTHTLEVALIARTLARALRLNEDLVEALALMHDIGHPPFGHAGETVLNDCMQGDGGFDHNRQALRIVQQLESRDPLAAGLNLSAEVLEGQSRRAQPEGGEMPASAAGALLEIQVVDAADSMAYDAHDADDALELGLLSMDELLELPLWKDAAIREAERFPDLGDRPWRRLIVRSLIDELVTDVVAATRARIAAEQLDSLAAVRRAPPVVHPSEALAAKKSALEAFLFQRVYRHPQVLAQRAGAQDTLRQMFTQLVSDPRRLPAEFRATARRESLPRAVTDYLAGLTDRSAWQASARVQGQH